MSSGPCSRSEPAQGNGYASCRVRRGITSFVHDADGRAIPEAALRQVERVCVDKIGVAVAATNDDAVRA